MSPLEFSLPVLWALVIGIAVAFYIVLDGFDLGIGILFPFFPREEDRDQMMNSVAPFWDGNETWLVLGGAGLFVAFPIAYSIVMPALYLPIIVMLLALVFRGVAFEFRWVAKPHHRKWDLAFTIGSTVASFAQGTVVGGLLDGIHVNGLRFAGGAFDWLSPFSLMCGAAVVVGYALLGATWLVLKTDGAVEKRSRHVALLALHGLLIFIAIVSIWTPIEFPRIADRWFGMPNLVVLAPVPILVALASWGCWRGLARGASLSPFLCAIAIFLLAYGGLVISNVPYLVPPSVTVWDAAAAPASLVFTLIGTVLLLPVILGYTALVYWIFRGKVKAGDHYH